MKVNQVDGPAPGSTNETNAKPVSPAQWRIENRDAMEDYNRWIAEYGMPLERYREF